MGWWTRLLRARQVTRPSGEENLLVISDMHLGEDILIEGPPQLAEYIRALNRELAGFVAAHRRQPLEGRPWRLVINGDMFDFAKVSLRREPEEAFEHWSRRAGEPVPSGGVPNTPENVAWKLSRIVEIHRPLFRELAHFLLDGHRITIVQGNHDAELFFDEVQETMRAELSRLAEQVHARDKRPEPFDPQALLERLRFSSWFEASPGRYHIEHGHQFDELCSFEYQLAPYDPGKAGTLATPMMLRAMPAYAELLGDFSSHGFGAWTFMRMVRFTLSFPPRVAWLLFKLYWMLAFDFVTRAGARRRTELSAFRQRHQDELRSLADQSPYGYATLLQLDAIKAQPAEYSLLKVIRAGYLDRFLVGGLGVLALVPALFLPWKAALALVAMVLVAGVGALMLLSRYVKPDVQSELQRAAGRIAALTGVRYVIFGHSHQPELVDLSERFGAGRFGERAFYLNTGSWVTREILLGARGQGMTYVEINSRGAALKRWSGEAGASEVLAATDAAAGAVEPEPAEESVG